MLNRNRRQEAKLSGRAHETSLIAEGTLICGDLRFTGALHLDGRIEGSIVGESEHAIFTLSEHGQVKGEIRVAHAVINGRVDGNVFAATRLELAAQACITGDVHYRSLEMTAGEEVNGRMTHTVSKPDTTPELPSPLPPPA